MGHMGCTCGNDMWDGDGHIVFDVYFRKDIEKYLSLPTRKKHSFEDTFDKNNYERVLKYRYYFWRCDKCKAIHVWDWNLEKDESTEMYREYTLYKSNEKIPAEIISECDQVYPMNINEYDDTPLIEIINTNKKFKNKYFLSKDLLKIYILNFDTNIVEYVYNLKYESDADIDLKIDTYDDILIYTMTNENNGRSYEIKDGKRIDITENDYPHREVHFMIKVGEVFCEDKSKKVEIYNKYNMEEFDRKYGHYLKNSN